MARFVLIITAICTAVTAITYLIHRFLGKKKYIKYVPAVIFMVAGIYNMYMIRTNPGEGFEDMVKALYLVVNFACFISVVVTALFIDFIAPKLKK
ncbi:hypothetical protein LGK97_07945 [Clostridium sp. CS001]|uniref:hypothetical protein n=1 Tax=Clostridium sp. CS001 TaxID=2880648 RepID=UPI001CF50E5F|nr:hypothetical protein [Clostridium sp. CS001]MCB2289694.1 hypothetical protein [Clostridium sp. CS001]